MEQFLWDIQLSGLGIKLLEKRSELIGIQLITNQNTENKIHFSVTLTVDSMWDGGYDVPIKYPASLFALNHETGISHLIFSFIETIRDYDVTGRGLRIDLSLEKAMMILILLRIIMILFQ